MTEESFPFPHVCSYIRQNPGLLEKSFSLMLKTPRFIDFDNKRFHFRSKIKHQHDHHHSPLRISVRRAYVLEDSYNQLRMRSTQDLKGRLTVHFQGEEGIDAGGLTREWYQLLSRVIFDRGALLFTTVGNESTFQPNPNSVYQTEHLSYFKFVGRVVGKALFDGQLLDVHLTSVVLFQKHTTITYNHIPHSSPIPTVIQPPHLLPPFSSSNFKFKFNHLQLSQEKPIHSTKPYPPKPIHPNKQKTKYASAGSSIMSTPTTYIHPLTTKNPKDQGCRLYQGDPRPWRPGWRCRRSRGPDRGSPVEVVSSGRLDRGSAVAAVARSDGAARDSLGGGGSQYQSGANLPREKKRKGAWSGGRRWLRPWASEVATTLAGVRWPFPVGTPASCWEKKETLGLSLVWRGEERENTATAA
ncbi:hypothetical protein LR48_Vigan08g098600 [Vigna angularis]|uniref:HECT-type E3 ubiquitin transferase n=1 Tax=Phaseolus angularis TaxID=3914 RepID=A0A0L9V648_PHAAN|nr:hypothetical protein LR48_Vigan08g098600 [Vigna angularis]